MAAVTRQVQCHKQWRCWVRRPCCSRWQLHRQSSWFIARIKACHSLITTILNWLIYNLLVSHAKTPSSTCLRCYHLVMSEVCEWERMSLSSTLPSFDRALNHLPLFNSKDFRLSQKKLSMRSDVQCAFSNTFYEYYFDFELHSESILARKKNLFGIETVSVWTKC